MVLDTVDSQRFSIKYVDFWGEDGGGSVKGLLSVTEEATADGILSLDELVAWDLDWTGNSSVEAFSISSDDGSATALIEPGGFNLNGENSAFALDFSDADGLDQGIYEAGSGEQTLDLGGLIVEDIAAGTASIGDAMAGSVSISEVIDFEVDYSGFWGDEGSVQGTFSISEADAADGIASLDELISWSWDWTGNSDVAAFSLSSDEGSVTALIPPGGFKLDGTNTAFDSNFEDADGLDQGVYESASGEQYIDLGALIVEDLAAGTVAEGDAAIADASISLSGSNGGDDNGDGDNGGGDNGGDGGSTPAEDVLLYGNGNILTLVGGSGNDELYGSDKVETFNAGAGDDKLYSNGGMDVIDSGSGMDEVWLGGASDAIVILSEGEGYDFIANYQMGSTTLKGFAESELTFKDGAAGVEIFKGEDKLAIVGWKTGSDLAGAFVA